MALSYSSRWEILNATKKMVKEALESGSTYEPVSYTHLLLFLLVMVANTAAVLVPVSYTHLADEVAALMGLVLTSLEDEIFMKNNVLHLLWQAFQIDVYKRQL